MACIDGPQGRHLLHRVSIEPEPFHLNARRGPCLQIGNGVPMVALLPSPLDRPR
jgi:hypothetical protein